MTETVRRFDCGDPVERAEGLAFATAALKRGELVVMPTDTVYGLAADAFRPLAVERLLDAKGRGRDMPVPVLIGSQATVEGVATGVTDDARALIDAFWPGALTLVLRHQPSLAWDLGDTRGTVAVRMPAHPVAIDLLREVGPTAVSSANRTGLPPASSIDEAIDQLGDAVACFLDAGATTESVPSSIVDLTAFTPRLLREGALSFAALREIVPGLEPVA